MARGQSIWQSDPVELYRAWRARRRRGQAEEAALEVLDAVAPALRAGLTPAKALELAGTSAGGSGVVVGHAAEESDLGDAIELARSGSGVATFWERWASRSGSGDIGFVASAWALSEECGAPLAEAVERACAQLRSGQSRRRRLAAAVAGPRATVTVLTALPLTGPLFGAASGLSPADLYLGSRLTVAALILGVALIGLGRWWCLRIISAALAP